MNSFYVTTPIYYVNGLPHIGHSYTTIAADVLSRHKRRRGADVFFLTGTDEHGQKIVKAAQEKNLSPQEFVDGIIPKFKEAWKKLDISYDDFIRTTDPRHIEAVRYFLQVLYDKGELTLGDYEGLYCVPCEVFWTEKQAEAGVCPDCKRSVERITEKNYFFKLSRHQEWLIRYIEEHPDFIQPVSRRNEVLTFLKENELTDLCVSRPKSRLSWGISLPFSPDHVTYVWFDALINYISALDFPKSRDKFEKFWPVSLHLMGKDILRQHAVIWPIMLHAAGLNPPGRIFAHGWWQVGQEKMSKSRGNVIDPLSLIDEFGIDVYRYFLLRDVPFGLDGVFSRESLIRRFNGDLANDLGNLVFRTLTMSEKYVGGALPSLEAGPASGRGADIVSKSQNLPAVVDAALDKLDFIAALEGIWSVIADCNKFVEETKPWNLKKEGRDGELKHFLAVLFTGIRSVACELEPFMPNTSAKILVQIKGDVVSKGDPLFPRIEDEKKNG